MPPIDRRGFLIYLHVFSRSSRFASGSLSESTSVSSSSSHESSELCRWVGHARVRVFDMQCGKDTPVLGAGTGARWALCRWKHDTQATLCSSTKSKLRHLVCSFIVTVVYYRISQSSPRSCYALHSTIW